MQTSRSTNASQLGRAARRAVDDLVHDRFASDSPLEESGFEPLVPPSESAQPRHRPDLADCYTVTRLALQGDRFARAGPGVRIRYAPAASPQTLGPIGQSGISRQVVVLERAGTQSAPGYGRGKGHVLRPDLRARRCLGGSGRRLTTQTAESTRSTTTTLSRSGLSGCGSLP
jgi:hypothetical protein